MTTYAVDPSDILLPFDEVLALCQRTLQALGTNAAHAQAIAKVIAAGQRDACASHGIYRLISCAQAIAAGKVQLDVEPVIQEPQGAVIRVDAGFGFSPLAFERGLPHLVHAAREYGLAALAIDRCFHFSALWPEIEAITAQGLVALAMTPSHSWVAPAGGRVPVFGTNPLAFGWPRLGKQPYVFDFATSAIARGDLELHRRAGSLLPEGSGVDANGQASQDPQAVIQGAMLTFGGHKGSALSTMIELMAGSLIGAWTSQQSQQFDAGDGVTPCHGELILALDPRRLGGGDTQTGQASAEALFANIEQQGARLPSQRRFQARAASEREGVRIPRKLYDEVLQLTAVS